MNAADRSQLLQVLHSRRDAIADSWCEVITQIGFVSLLSATDVRQHIIELTEQVIALLLTEPFEPGEAQAIGVALARLRILQPEILARTQEALALQIVGGLPAGQVVALQPRLAALLGELAAGFLRQTRDTLLAEQEQIHNALITELRRGQEALRESEETARAFLNAFTDPAVLIDLDGAIVDLNEAAADRLGRSREELVGTFALYSFPPDVAQYRRAQGERVIRSGRSMRFEDQRGGRWFDQSIYPVFDAQGKVVRLAVVARDVTERKRAEKALRDSEARYRAISELVSSFAYALGVEPDGEIVFEWATDGFTAITGFTSEEATARGGWPTVVHPDDGPIADQHLQALLSGQQHMSEFRILTKSGGVRWLRDWGRPVWDETQGRVTRVLGAARDITERRRMEQDLHLAERLAAVGRFAAGLAHEINNPLQVIRSNLELVLDFDLDADERERCLHVTRRHVEHLVEVVQRVLNVARPADDTRYPVRINRLMQRTLALVGEQLQSARVQVATDFPADLPPIFAAPDQIVQVLLNLTMNAVEAMPDGGHLHVTARVDGDMLALALTNDGPPIPPEHIGHIFDPFFTTKSAGVGLGLSISHRIVRKHGGTISVENLSCDQGVTFTVTLPVVHAAKGRRMGT